MSYDTSDLLLGEYVSLPTAAFCDYLSIRPSSNTEFVEITGIRQLELAKMNWFSLREHCQHSTM